MHKKLITVVNAQFQILTGIIIIILMESAKLCFLALPAATTTLATPSMAMNRAWK